MNLDVVAYRELRPGREEARRRIFLGPELARFESSALAVLAVVTISYFSLDSADGSGYLGAFLAGLIVGNMEHLGLAMHSTHEYEIACSAQARPTSGRSSCSSSWREHFFDDLGEHLLPALAVLPGCSCWPGRSSCSPAPRGPAGALDAAGDRAGHAGAAAGGPARAAREPG